MNNNKTRAICLIIRSTNEQWLNFLNAFTLYDVYVIFDQSNVYKQYTNINIIDVDMVSCVKKGYQYMTFRFRKQITAWDKAMYYFCELSEKTYDNIWFFEDDVFFNSEETLINIDKKDIENSDLIIKQNNRNDGEKNNIWLWNRLIIKMEYPWFGTMACAFRISNNMLKCVKDYVEKNKRLMYMEVMFGTLAYHNNLKIFMPDELQSIIFKKIWSINDINENNLYHPVKNINDHLLYRNKFK